MLTKDEFRNYVKGWIKFNKYLDALYDLDITVAEAPSVENLNNNYVNLLCKTMELKNDNLPWANILEDFLWNYDENYSDEEIDNLYRKIASSKFYSVEDKSDLIKEKPEQKKESNEVDNARIDYLLSRLGGVRGKVREEPKSIYELWMDYLLP
ncbi:MAG: hypothetical protein IJH65_03845 [Methanobrevibacter sp.]|nr:hypothetical protein [Methanobrevibacter sp.]